jgi:hypothetical protein
VLVDFTAITKRLDIVTAFKDSVVEVIAFVEGTSYLAFQDKGQTFEDKVGKKAFAAFVDTTWAITWTTCFKHFVWKEFHAVAYPQVTVSSEPGKLEDQTVESCRSSGLTFLVQKLINWEKKPSYPKT